MFETQKTNRGNIKINQLMGGEIHKTESSVKILELKKLSDQGLLSQTKYLVQKERNITIQVLRALSEIESRKLYLKRGFSSLFDYVVKELGYSEGSAYRRIKAMKLCQEMPNTVSKLKAGSLNLTTVSKLQTYFEKQDKKAKKAQTEFNFPPEATCVKDNKDVNDDEDTSSKITAKNEENYKINKDKTTDLKVNHELRRSDSPARRIAASFQKNKAQKLDLLEKLTGKSSRQTDKLLCEMDPEIHQIKDKVRHLNKDQVEIKLTLDKSSYENLETLKSLLSHKNPNMSYGELFKILSELGLDKYDLRQKLKKQNAVNPKQQTFENKNKCRGQLEKKDKTIKKNFPPEAARVRNNKEVSSNINCKNNKSDGSDKNIRGDINCKNDTNYNSEENGNKRVALNSEENKNKIKNKNMSNNNISQIKQSRYIPTKIKRLVWTRDQGQCTYICPETKKKCSSKHFLQIDHIHPYALGGSSKLSNLRLLCAGHNQYRIFSFFRKRTEKSAELRKHK